MDNNDLDWLANWYVRECNNDWEHSYGIKIDTLDNPGWTIEIDLRETSLEGRPFEAKHGEPARDLDEWRELGSWWAAKADGVRFKAACGPTDLSSVIGVFRQWVESQKT
ncbi:immunity 53 family protein [Erythrobacter neustonensis]|uniref:Rhodanese-related sulfurtransferase n=1 Tax=Erythrobacter neustonensis TaxID=1112 RepID=A0A192D3P4_9SPHN|nr:immunity 53 family protein [Erythrobacter neustonensis]ANK12735.1 hypothetical protein A9D12_07010 [Erythrobacter neustonensis]